MCYFIVSVITGIVEIYIYMYISVKLEIVVYVGVVVNGSQYEPIKHII